ncbi:glutathione S-transferase family protein [uncultured Roseibium sp.]|uniref:glutathione S-transferase family protein n=1 Tax=uncultured Roseibium sp. TaxID=1936171 RepID=UPI002602E437|nr:glutathione S-transferase family protein [uncultured Roseibium sp.]
MLTSTTPKRSDKPAAGTYRLHGSPDSANLVVRLVLEEMETPYQYVPVDRLRSEQNSEAYLKLNPQGLIPVLEVPGQDAPLFETGAILLHLVETHGCLGPAVGSLERGRFLKWLFFISNTLHSELRISFKPYKYVAEGRAAEDLSDGLILRIARSFDLLDREIWASGGPYLMGQELTCLDHYAACCARWAQIYRNDGKWAPLGTPYLKRMIEELEDRPAVNRACSLEGIKGLPFSEPKPVTLPGTTA